MTDKAGVGHPGWGMGAVAADFDGDGWEDLYVTCYGPNHLYRNNRDGTFTDVTAKAGVGDPRWSTGRGFADYDRDGGSTCSSPLRRRRLDALPEFGKGKSCEYRGIPVQCGPRGLPGSGDSLYRNEGDGTFEDVSAKAGVADPAGRFGMGVAWFDFNGDGRPDLYVANDAGPNFCTRTTATARSRRSAFRLGTAVSEDGEEQGSMGVAVGDYDHTGGWSIFVTNFADEYNALYRHDKAFPLHATSPSVADRASQPAATSAGARTSSTTTTTAGSTCSSSTAMSTRRWSAPALATSYAQRKLLYRNNRRRHVRGGDVDAQARRSTEPAVSRGSAAGDLDNDGDLDVVINNLDGAHGAAQRWRQPRQLSGRGPRRPHGQSQRRWRRRHRQRRRSRAACGAAQRRQLSVAQRRAPALRTRDAHESRFSRSPLAEWDRSAIR